MVSLSKNSSSLYKLLFSSVIWVGLGLILAAHCQSAPADSDAPARGSSATSDFIEDLEYTRIAAALERYERIAESGGWPVLPPGPTMGPGSTDPRTPLLMKRLAATGDLVGDVQSGQAFDDVIEAAVIRFQVRHGLEPDGLVGKKTLRAMNIPIAERVAQLGINLERIAGVLRADRKDYLLVNVPAYEIYLVRGETTLWDAKVIVGEPETETPLFESAITHVVFNPTWTVPRKIASEELLPKIQEDINFLTAGGYKVVDVNGSTVEPQDIDWMNLDKTNFPYTLVQQPGPMNELGLIKFLFPNDYGVCMHDTASRYLFENSSRALSHGCIRVDEPLDLAEHLLRAHGWNRDQIDEQIRRGETLTVTLAPPVPLYVTYLTARVSEDNTVFFYRDIYGRDVTSETSSPN